MLTQTVTESLDVCLSALYSRFQLHDSLSVGRSSTVKMGSSKLATGFITSTLHVELMNPKLGNTLDLYLKSFHGKYSQSLRPKQEEHTVRI